LNSTRPTEILRITLIQSGLFWENIDQNLSAFADLMDGITQETDLILLPETFSTGFTSNPGFAETMNGKAVQFLRNAAGAHQCLVCGSIIISQDGKNHNRLICMFPDGNYLTYDKRHLFRLSKEVEVFTPGQKTIIVPWKGWNIMPLVCYDLRFPVWSRNSYQDGAYRYDLLLYTANWPVGRAEAWKALLVARAMENQAFVAGINRVGEDGNGLVYAGESMVVDPSGSITGFGEKNTEMVVQASVSMTALKNHRESFPFGQDWDRFQLLP